MKNILRVLCIETKMTWISRYITINQFRGFAESELKSTEELMSEVLMFALDQPSIDLNALRDCMTKEEAGFSLMKQAIN